MNLDQVVTALRHAHEVSGHTDYVVIGSLSVLGVEDDSAIPADMSMSIDIDCYTRADPPRIFDLQSALGENSPFRARHGYYLDPVSPSLPSLPDGWEQRMACVERDGLRIWFLDPNDAAVSKYARSEPRDLRWIRAGIASGLVSLPAVQGRLKSTRFLDAEEEQRVRRQIQEDTALFAATASARNIQRS
jgi:hypothetical protein